MPAVSEITTYQAGETITAGNVHAFETYYRAFEPKSSEYDAGLKTYLEFLSAQLEAFGEKPEESLVFPLAIYDQPEIQNIDGLKPALLAGAKAQRLAIKDRGRGQFGQISSSFWNNAEETADLNQALAQRYWKVAEALGVTSDEWHTQVMNPPELQD